MPQVSLLGGGQNISPNTQQKPMFISPTGATAGQGPGTPQGSQGSTMDIMTMLALLQKANETNVKAQQQQGGGGSGMMSGKQGGAGAGAAGGGGGMSGMQAP